MLTGLLSDVGRSTVSTPQVIEDSSWFSKSKVGSEWTSDTYRSASPALNTSWQNYFMLMLTSKFQLSKSNGGTHMVVRTSCEFSLSENVYLE